MLSWEEIVQNYIIEHSDKIQQVTRPLREHFQINYFTYHRIDKNGKYTVLVDRPDWAEYYVEEKLYLTDPMLRNPDVYKPGFCLFEADSSDEHIKKVVREGKEIFNLDFGVIQIEKSQDYVEFFGYFANKAESGLDKLHLNQPEILKSFASHFKSELKPILTEMTGEASSLIDLKGDDYHRKDPIQPNLSREKLLKYLEAIGKKEEIRLASTLSIREKQCILGLLSGYSAKETAAALQLSARTVESYLENIKNKLSCYTKQDLISVGQTLKVLGLLP